jgi:hypothetical protein
MVVDRIIVVPDIKNLWLRMIATQELTRACSMHLNYIKFEK